MRLHETARFLILPLFTVLSPLYAMPGSDDTGALHNEQPSDNSQRQECMPVSGFNASAAIADESKAKNNKAQNNDVNSNDVNSNDVNSNDVNSNEAKHNKLNKNPADRGRQEMSVGDIYVRVDPIFDETDPQQDKFVFRLANRLHPLTRKTAVFNQLLFKEGDPYSEEKLAESERTLRSRRYLYDAEIKPLRECNGKVDVQVRVRDLWTLFPDFSLTREGGENSSRIGIRDTNFLGFGKEVVVVQKNNPDEEGTSFSYSDPNLFGTKNTMLLRYQDKKDGDFKGLSLAHPFYSVDTPWSVGFTASEDKRDDELYFRNDEFQEFAHQDDDYNIFLGLSGGVEDNEVYRWFVGFAKRKDDFVATDDTDPEEPFPENRDITYPWIGIGFLQNRFVELTNINQMNRTEDFNAGYSAFFELGYFSEQVGASSEGFRFEGFAGRSYLLGDQHVFTWRSDLSGIYDKKFQDAMASVDTRYYYNGFDNQQFYAALRLTAAENLFTDNQLLLGGATGLRGYPIRYQVGNLQFLFTLEQRFYLFNGLWQLFDVGGAVFADVGRAWFDNRDNGFNGGVLTDVGFGLRFSSLRAGKNTVLHLDLAFPLDKDDEEIEDSQLQFVVKNSF